jgi:hypothetical protein
MSAVQLISQADYAKRRGVSQVAVHKAVKAGRITLIEGRIDPAVADIQWQANTRTRVSAKPPPHPGAAHGAGDARGPTLAAVQAQAGAHLGAHDGADADGGDYWASRARREKAEAALAELKLEEARGSLVRADDIRATLARRAATFREALLQIPARLSAQLVAETNQAKVHALIDHELRTAMAHLVQGE